MQIKTGGSRPASRHTFCLNGNKKYAKNAFLLRRARKVLVPNDVQKFRPDQGSSGFGGPFSFKAPFLLRHLW